MTDPKPPNTPPLPNSYWVIPGKLLGGEYPGGEAEEETRQRLRALMDAGVDCFVNLTRPGELPAYSTQLPEGIWYFHLPIVDHGLPVDRDVHAADPARPGQCAGGGPLCLCALPYGDRPYRYGAGLPAWWSRG